METPSQEIFNEMKSIATDIWRGYDDEFGYVTEKLNRINSFDNVEDNAMVFYTMFDSQNQVIFIFKASSEVRNYIKNNL
jgi:hypothetical protein